MFAFWFELKSSLSLPYLLTPIENSFQHYTSPRSRVYSQSFMTLLCYCFNIESVLSLLPFCFGSRSGLIWAWFCFMKRSDSPHSKWTESPLSKWSDSPLSKWTDSSLIEIDRFGPFARGRFGQFLSRQIRLLYYRPYFFFLHKQEKQSDFGSE